MEGGVVIEEAASGMFNYVWLALIHLLYLSR